MDNVPVLISDCQLLIKFYTSRLCAEEKLCLNFFTFKSCHLHNMRVLLIVLN